MQFQLNPSSFSFTFSRGKLYESLFKEQYSSKLSLFYDTIIPWPFSNEF
jgi:hypothetical protein